MIVPHRSDGLSGVSDVCAPEAPTGEDEAVAYLRRTAEAQRPRPLVPHLQRAYGLTVAEACAAIGTVRGTRVTR